MSVRIKVDNLSKKMKAVQALDQVGIDFDPGRLHGLIGPDGAGKTTLMRLMVGLLVPDKGQAVYFDKKKEVSFDLVRPRLAYMPQQQSLYADLTVKEHLEFFREIYLIPKEKYVKKQQELLHMTRMTPFQDRLAGKLSGGMYKKLGLMCALLQSPEALLLDEPTNGVDPISRREFWELLYRLIDKGVLVIVSTAYMDEAERCSRVHVLDNGHLLATGEPRKVLQKEGVDSFEMLFVKREGGDMSLLQKEEKQAAIKVKKSIKKKVIKKVVKKTVVKKAAKKKTTKKSIKK